jgi:putative SOS response-associated peptidase YedK
MCGRYTLTSSPEAIRALFRYREEAGFPPRYNVAPTQPIPVVRRVNGEPSLALMRWGLIPSWVKDPGVFSLLVNARGEGVNDKPAFRHAMKRRRCLVPADGFYEWKDEGGRRRPYFVRKAGGGPLAFAGLWETWTGPNGEEMETAAIITTDANKEMAQVHHRAPAIVPPDVFDFWLDTDNVDAKTAAAAIGPAPHGSMEVYEVSTAVNRVANDRPELIEPHHAEPEPAPAAAEESKPKSKTKPKSAAHRKRGNDDGQSSLF